MQTAQLAKYTMEGGYYYLNLVILPKNKLAAVFL